VNDSLQLPTGWTSATIGDMAEPTVEQAKPSGFGTFLYVDISSIDRSTKRVVDAKILPVQSAPSRARQRLLPDDVLVSMTRPNLNAVAMLPREMEGAVGSTGFFVLRSRHVVPNWLFYLVQTAHFIDSMSGAVLGVLYPAVRPKDITAYSVGLPPVQEQERIVDEIEKQFTQLDAAVAALKRVQANLKRYRAAVLKAACEGRLVPTEAELVRKEGRSYETGEQLLASILKERRAKWESDHLAKMHASGKPPKNEKWKQKYKEPAIPEKKGLPMLPEGWKWSTIGQLADLGDNSITDGPFGSNLKTEHYTDVGPRVVRLQNIGDGVFRDAEAHISHEHFNKLKKHAVRRGDVVIAALGDPAPRACLVPEIGPAIVKADCIRFRASTGVLQSFVMFALNSEDVRKRTTDRIHGVGRPRLNLQEIKEIVIPLPPTNEQERIAEELDRRWGSQEKASEALASNLARADGLRQSILKRAFEGELVPQDPNDEPASALLERIRSSMQSKPSVKLKDRKAEEITMPQGGTPRPIVEVLRERNC
jgi:type I restriction enzyme S subunit